MNNCLFYAIYRHLKNGDCIIVRKTRRSYFWPFCRYHYMVAKYDCIDKYILENSCHLKDIKTKIKNGEYIIISKNRRRFGFSYRFSFVSENIGKQLECLEGYVPVKSTLGNFPMPIFKGYVKKGDD